MNKIMSFSILLFLFLLFSCGIGGPAGRYLSHIDRVYTILIDNQKDTVAAVEKMYEYVEKNRENIEKASLEMKQLNVNETEKAYLPVTKAVNRLIQYLEAKAKEDDTLLKQEKFDQAIKILLK